MPDICHTFRSGRRIMVQIQNTWFPLVDRKPQQFLNIPDAKASDFRKATERIYGVEEDGSRLRVQVLPRSLAILVTDVFETAVSADRFRDDRRAVVRNEVVRNAVKKTHAPGGLPVSRRLGRTSVSARQA
jgi:hypothetical protein